MLFLVLLAFVLSSCSFDLFSPPKKDKETFETEISVDSIRTDFLRIFSNNEVVILGTNEASARTLEKPQMKVIMGYDFSIGKHMVTCSEFADLMDHFSEEDCESKNFPVTNVTFFDAVLFANEKSKHEKQDTAYAYSSATFDSNGHCIKLADFSFDASRDAYRLPTEAEWTMLAERYWNPDEEWNAGNSDYKLHDVCTAKSYKENSKSVSAIPCDMVGNAMEWVNDWMGHLRDTTIQNYAGAPNGGGIGERILKGGSYNKSAQNTTLYGRSDVYTVTSSSKADYVGFRLVFGKIPDARWMDANGNSTTVQIRSLIDYATLTKITESNQVKLAFRNDETGDLNYVNFSNTGFRVTEIQDTLDAFHPVISPDGRRIAFSTKYEGIGETSELYVRDLNAKGSNRVKLDVKSAAIPRWRVVGADTQIVYVSNAGTNNDESEWKTQSTWSVTFADGHFGKPVKLFDGTFNGGVSKNNELAVSGARILRAFNDHRDTVWYDGLQACNVSLSDSTKQTLFLDFKGTLGQEFVGESYRVHERVFITDSTGKLLNSVGAPKGYTFDHSEWAHGNKNLAVASLSNSNGAHTKISLINTQDSSVVNLIEGAELWHPDLWMNSTGVTLEPSDSTGIYFISQDGNPYVAQSVEMAIKLQRFWRERESVEFIVVGSSMSIDAVDEDSIKSYKTLNMGISLCEIDLSSYLLNRYIFPYANNLKVVYVELSPDFFHKTEDEFLNEMRKFSPGLIYDETHLNPETADDIAEYSQNVDYPTDLFAQDYIEGSFLLHSRSWGYADVSVDTTFFRITDFNIARHLAMCKQLKEKADSLGIKLFFAITPRHPKYRNTGAFGLWGPSQSLAHQIIDSIKNMGIEVFDENKYGLHDYTNEMANNNIHLSYLGAWQFTRRLDEFLKALK